MLAWETRVLGTGLASAFGQVLPVQASVPLPVYHRVLFGDPASLSPWGGWVDGWLPIASTF